MKIELDEEIIEVACRVCLKFVRQKRCRVSVHDVAAELEKCQLFHTGLDEDEVRSLLMLLVETASWINATGGCTSSSPG